MLPPRWFLVLALLLGLSILHAQRADVSGAWSFKAASPQGERQAKLTLTQDGEKITGALSATEGEFKIEGTIRGDKIEFRVHYTGGDQPIQVPFQGTTEGERMSGTYAAGEASRTWSAERTKQ